MKVKKKMLVYEPPKAVDLTGLSAKGQEHPQSTCAPGNYPWTECAVGATVGLGTGCSPTGVDPAQEDCVAGFFAGNPQCSSGSSANVGCFGPGANQDA